MPGSAPATENQKLVREDTALSRIPASGPDTASPESSHRLPVSVSSGDSSVSLNVSARP